MKIYKITEASEYLGVSINTLKTLANKEVEVIKTDGGGYRFNSGKTRHDLVPAFAQEQYARVLTVGADKYGDDNWRRGMPWSTILASMKRHILAIERGEDYDKETGLLHSAHVMCNAAFLTEYYKIYPQGDNRYKRSIPRIGLDIDGVLVEFSGGYNKHFGTPSAVWWNWDPKFKERFSSISNKKYFWDKLERKCDPSTIPFSPVCYITDRPIPVEWTIEWLYRNGFASVPVFTANSKKSKADIAKEQHLDIFVDDSYINYEAMNDAGICCYLFDCTHNRRFSVGARRIHSLVELL